MNDIVTGFESGMAKENYNYYNNLKNRTIVINGEIDDYCIDEIILPLIQMDNDGTGKPITIYINTPGGVVYVGLNLCDIISKLKTKTTIICMAYAYSMGSLIMMAGKNNPNVHRKCYKFSTALIHAGSTYLQGSSTQVKDTYEFTERFENKISDYILDNSNIPEETYEKKTRYEWYLTAEEMLEYGLVDEIL